MSTICCDFYGSAFAAVFSDPVPAELGSEPLLESFSMKKRCAERLLVFAQTLVFPGSVVKVVTETQLSVTPIKI